MRVRLLGTAAGGGFPQWNCACRLCKSGAPPRSQDCVAVSADGSCWYLINASPDIRAQILSAPALTPGPGPRETPIQGVLLTDAELDHSLGLLMLRETSGGLPVWAPEAVLHALRDCFGMRKILDGYGGWDWRPVTPGLALGGLRVSLLPVSAKRPKYARSSTVDGPWVVAYRIENPATGGVLVYAPCLADWPDGFGELVSDASLVVLDGTFHSSGELSGGTLATDSAQRAMGHLPITGPGGTLTRISRHRETHPATRWAYTHLNNTNPVLSPGSPEHNEVLAAGAELPLDGTEYKL